VHSDIAVGFDVDLTPDPILFAKLVPNSEVGYDLQRSAGCK
jgi:hypothetical protein